MRNNVFLKGVISLLKTRYNTLFALLRLYKGVITPFIFLSTQIRTIELIIVGENTIDFGLHAKLSQTLTYKSVNLFCCLTSCQIESSFAHVT